MKTMYWYLLFLAVVFTGCATYKKEPYFMSKITFNPESQLLWARPSEIGYKVSDDITGSAEVVTFFGFVVEGERPASMAVGTGPFKDPLIKFAVIDAINKFKVDGMYVTQSIVTKSGFWPFRRRKKAFVKGKGLLLKDYGEVDKSRSDNERILKLKENYSDDEQILILKRK
ncbi:MAG: hypothetical protein Q7K21_06470 [Elusimicrobiota bacterium]|nr:hypothetical protein [Elusimicrobiota bacterium]